MSRYRNISFSSDETPRRYVTVKYPEIPKTADDYYVIPTIGDRYDTLALTYYSDSSLWWIVSSANPTDAQDSLTPTPGVQLRIPHPSRVFEIISEYDSLNS